MRRITRKTAPLLQAFAKAVMVPKAKSPAGQPEPLSYYKGNMNTIVGDGEIVPWPAYTSRLDVEPELAVVYGNEKQSVAGFCVFNDIGCKAILRSWQLRSIGRAWRAEDALLEAVQSRLSCFPRGDSSVARRRRRWETYVWTGRIHRQSFLRKKWPGDFRAN